MTAAVKAEQASGIYGAALIAIGSHIADHRLPAPHDILHDDGQITICLVDANAWRPWIESVSILEGTEVNEFHPSLPERLITHWMVRLDTCTVVQLRAIRPAPLLRAVGS